MYNKSGVIYAILSGICFGFMGYFGMKLMDSMSVSNLCFWRFLVSTFVVGTLSVNKIKIESIKPRQLVKVILYGITLYSMTSMLYFRASNYIGTGLAMVIFFTFPVIVIFFNKFFYRAQINKIIYFSASLILIGILLLVDLEGLKFDIIGVALSFLSALLYAGYIVVSKNNSLSPLVSTFAVSIGCMLNCFIISLAEGNFFIPTSLNIWINILGLGVISTALPILFFLKALQSMSTEKASILAVLEPVFVVIIGVALLGEKVNFEHFCGIVLVLSGAVLSLFEKIKHKNI